MKVLGIACFVAAVALWHIKPYEGQSLGGFGPTGKIYYGRAFALVAVAAGMALVLLG